MDKPAYSTLPDKSGRCRWCASVFPRRGSLYCSKHCEECGRTMRAERTRCLRVIEDVRVSVCDCDGVDNSTACASCHIIGQIDQGIRIDD